MNFKYRPEIDGLRALAVISVILFHAGIPLFKGGFVGVDIFFVISGYLITSIILKDIDKNNFKILKFYERRARRILPALIIIVIFSSIFSLILFNSEDLIFFFKSTISSLTFWSNLQFHNEADYFAKTSEFKPLLHTWSLSIEEQFYIIFPLLVILILSLNKKLLLITTILIFFLSLMFAQWSGNLSRNFPFFDADLNFLSKSEYSTFFMPFGRIWEIALGSICALILRKNILKKNQFSNLISLTGFILIIISIFYLSENFPFPSFYTLIPALGTALIILFTFESDVISKLLRIKILVFLGLISYSLYLFHFPIFTFFKHSNIEINYLILSFLILTTFILSFLNWKFIEKPFRSKKINLNKFIYFISASYLIIFLTSLYALNFKIPNKLYIEDLSTNLQKSLVSKIQNKECLDTIRVQEDFNQKGLCYLGDKNQKKTNLIIFGDSHTLPFYQLLNDYFKRSNKKALLTGYSGCPPLIGVYSIRSDQMNKNCKELNNKIFEFAKNNNIKNILLISRWTYYTGEELPNGEFNAINKSLNYNTNVKTSKINFKKAVEETFKKYGSININVFVIEQAPFHYFTPSQAYLRSYDIDKNYFKNRLNSYSIKYDEFQNNQNFSRSILSSNASKYENINFLGISDIFCLNIVKVCKIGDHDKSFYRDKNHLNQYGADLLKERILENIDK